MARRKGIMNALRQWSPPPALGVPPEVITEPFTVMLWGITSDSVRQWLGGAPPPGRASRFRAPPGGAPGAAPGLLPPARAPRPRQPPALPPPPPPPTPAPACRPHSTP